MSIVSYVLNESIKAGVPCFFIETVADWRRNNSHQSVLKYLEKEITKCVLIYTLNTTSLFGISIAFTKHILCDVFPSGKHFLFAEDKERMFSAIAMGIISRIMVYNITVFWLDGSKSAVPELFMPRTKERHQQSWSKMTEIQ